MEVKHCDLKYIKSTDEDGISWTLIQYQGRRQTWREEHYYLYKIVQDDLDESALTYYLRAAGTMPDYRKEWRVAGKQMLRKIPRDDEVIFGGQPGQSHNNSAQRELAQRLTEHDSDSSVGAKQGEGGKAMKTHPTSMKMRPQILGQARLSGRDMKPGD